MEPLPVLSTKGWSLQSLLDAGSNFRPVPRVFYDDASLSERIAEYEAGEPYVIEGYQKDPRWPDQLFEASWFREHCGSLDIPVRNIHDRSDSVMRTEYFLDQALAASPYVQDGEKTRLYGKDAPCPTEYRDWLHKGKLISECFLPLTEHNLLRNLPPDELVETLMCYLGIGDTFTPCHKDLCASSGHNLMCYAPNGSSFWFMTRGCDAPVVSQYFSEKMKQELDHETHTITVEELAAAPFPVFITEQRVGDMVLVPPRCAHQVVNHGGLTIKTAWSRMTLRGLGIALYHELPLYRRVCRQETYKIKSVIYHTMQAWTQLSQHHCHLAELVSLFDDILIEENDSSDRQYPHMETHVDVICDFCGCDIFQSFFECSACVPGRAHPTSRDANVPPVRPTKRTRRHKFHTSGVGPPPADSGFLLCAGCYVEGRTCKCTNMRPVQVRPSAELLEARRRAVDAIQEFHQQSDKDTPDMTLHLEQHASAFQAACFINEARRAGEDGAKLTRTCRPSTNSHEVPRAAVLPCKPCHSGRCFDHLLLRSCLHSSEAIHVYTGDESNVAFHELHKTGRSRFERIALDLAVRQRDGGRPDPQMVLAYTALHHSVCKPMNPAFSLPGWYDRTIQYIEVETPDAASLSCARDLVSAPPVEQSNTSSGSASHIAEDRSPPSLQGKESRPLSPEQKTRKRKRHHESDFFVETIPSSQSASVTSPKPSSRATPPLLQSSPVAESPPKLRQNLSQQERLRQSVFTYRIASNRTSTSVSSTASP